MYQTPSFSTSSFLSSHHMGPSRQFMESKRLIVIVDSSNDLDFHWQLALKDLIADIVKFIHPEGSISQDPVAPKPSLGLLVYGSQGPCTEPQLKPMGWTDNLKTFLQWLSVIPFTSGECSEAALSRALSSTLQIIAAANINNEAPVFGQTHCILVSSYESSENDEMLDNNNIWLRKLDRFLVDATSVARRFTKSFVSLSVISPKQSSRLREIFRAGNVNQQLADDCTENQEDFNYLILLSDKFKESHEALSYRDFVIEQTAEKDNRNGSYFGKHHIPASKEKSSGIDRVFGEGSSSGASRASNVPVQMIEALPINLHEPIPDVLTEIEVRLLQDNYYSDVS